MSAPAAVAPRAYTLDMSGHACPLPLLGAKRILDDLPDGQDMVLISDCPGTAGDLEVWASVTGHEIAATIAVDARRVAYTIRRRLAPGGNPNSVVLDRRGQPCPDPILEAKRQLDRMQPGEVLVLLSDCAFAPSDIDVWSENTSVELLDRFRNRAGHFEFYLRRRAAKKEFV